MFHRCFVYSCRQFIWCSFELHCFLPGLYSYSPPFITSTIHSPWVFNSVRVSSRTCSIVVNARIVINRRSHTRLRRWRRQRYENISCQWAMALFDHSFAHIIPSFMSFPIACVLCLTCRVINPLFVSIVPTSLDSSLPVLFSTIYRPAFFILSIWVVPVHGCLELFFNHISIYSPHLFIHRRLFYCSRIASPLPVRSPLSVCPEYPPNMETDRDGCNGHIPSLRRCSIRMEVNGRYSIHAMQQSIAINSKEKLG